MRRNPAALSRIVVIFGSALVLFGATLGQVEASPILSVDYGDTRSDAFFVPDSAFTVPPPANVYGNLPTATVGGIMTHVGDVDFFSFNGLAGQEVYFDLDDARFDSTLSLFNSQGTLLAFCDDIAAGYDPGTTSALEAFLGVYTLPETGLYYVAVSESYPVVMEGWSGGLERLYRPDNGLGGHAILGAPIGGDAFHTRFLMGVDKPYNLQITRDFAPIPEPATLTLLGVGFAGVALLRRRRGLLVNPRR